MYITGLMNNFLCYIKKRIQNHDLIVSARPNKSTLDSLQSSITIMVEDGENHITQVIAITKEKIFILPIVLIVQVDFIDYVVP
jgi:hypothetical protein